jgi:DNA-binding HxlR family transcriptional regulator
MFLQLASDFCRITEMGKAKSDCRQSGCPIAFTLDIFGDKWSILIVRDMILNGKKHYGELLESPERIASNILADRLKRLEEARIITKNPDPENRKKYVYELTQKGVDLLPLVLEAAIWGSKYVPENSTPKEFLRRLKKDRDAVTQEILESLRRKESILDRKHKLPF